MINPLPGHGTAVDASVYLAAIVESSDDAIISKNLDGIITSWNPAAERIYGFTAAEAIGQPITIIIPKELWAEERTILERLRHGEKIDHFQTIRIAKDGRTIFVSLTVSPIRDSNTGKIIGASKISRDITLQKQLEEETAAQHEWYRVTLGSIGDAVIATDTESRVTFLNPEAERMTGWTSQEAIGQPLDVVFHIINEDTRQISKNPVAKVIQHGKIEGLANHTALISRDGSEHAIEDSAAPIRMPDGRLIGVVLVFHSVNNRKELERELKNRAEMLMEKDRRKDEFLAMLAHELRNPLAPISNALHIMNFSSGNPEIQKEVVQVANRQVSQMVRLLDDLLDVSRITSGKIILHREHVSLTEVIQTAIEMARPLIRERRHTLKIDLPDPPIWVDGDPTRLSQLFGNLLNNAAKYTNPGGRIELDAHRENDNAIITVRDNGIGIPPDKLEYIFDMFAQVDNSLERTHGGLGIGLTLVKTIAEMHGGGVKAKSSGEGRGSRFTVCFPALADTHQDPESDIHHGGIMPARTAYRILVVDDNEASAKTLGWMVEMLGHEVKLAFDGPGAIKIAHEYKPDVILLDIGLPDMNGYEVCHALRKDPALRHTTFIAQSGWGQEHHLQRSQEVGFDYHLIKPISIKALQDQLEKVKQRAAA